MSELVLHPEQGYGDSLELLLGSADLDGLVGYRSANDWITFADGTSATTGATVTGLTNGVDYEFRVIAVNGIGNSAPSNIAGPYTPTGGGGATMATPAVTVAVGVPAPALTASRSMTSTSQPASRARSAATSPAAPAPMISTSHRASNGRPADGRIAALTGHAPSVHAALRLVSSSSCLQDLDVTHLC